MANDLIPLPESPAELSLRAAVEATAGFIAASRSKATRRAYASDWRHFEAWCSPGGLITIPAAPGTVAAYLSAMATAVPPAKLATIRRRVCAIGHFHQAAGQDNPCQHAGVKAALSGIARTLGVAPEKKAALTADMLARAVRRIPQDLAELRDCALLLIGFAAALTCGSLPGEAPSACGAMTGSAWAAQRNVPRRPQGKAPGMG